MTPTSDAHAFQVFLVEDDAGIRQQLTDVIQEVCAAHVVATAETEAAAVDWIRHHPDQWTLAVVDLFLKEGTGFGLLASLPERERSHVVVLTNSATAHNRTRCLALGAHAVFDKTAELDKFLAHCIECRNQPPN